MPKPKITALSLGYSGGMEIEGNFSYSVLMDNGGYHLQASLNSGNSEIEKKISKREYEALVKLFDDVDLASWRVSDYGNIEIALDAARFDFMALFSDESECRARSMSYAPAGFSEAVNAFVSLFKQTISEIAF